MSSTLENIKLDLIARAEAYLKENKGLASMIDYVKIKYGRLYLCYTYKEKGKKVEGKLARIKINDWDEADCAVEAEDRWGALMTLFEGDFMTCLKWIGESPVAGMSFIGWGDK